jgi:hypothetical protein
MYYVSTPTQYRKVSCRREREQFKSADWLHEAHSMPHQPFKEEVEEYLTGASEASELIYFKVFKSQVPVLEQALETAARMLGSMLSPPPAGILRRWQHLRPHW